MKTFLLCCSLLVAQIVVAQQKYLVTPSEEVIPLTKAESASEVIARRLRLTQSVKSNACTNQFTFGYTQDQYPFGVRHVAFHKDVMGEWFVAKASGKIDTIFWHADAANSAKDSLLYLRVHNSRIGPDFGPGARPGPYNPPCQNWGYWSNSQDLDNGVAAFIEDAFPDTVWHSTINNSPAPSQPPFFNEIWGLGGYPVTNHVNSINHVAMADLQLDLPLTVGQKFFISMRVNSLNTHVDDGTLGVTWQTWDSGVYVAASDENYPSRNWKFYEHDSGPSNCAGVARVNVKRGWVARGGFGGDALVDTLRVAALNWWYVMTVTTNVPPSITAVPNGDASTTFSSANQTIQYDILDCNPAHPESAGVASAVIKWSKATTDVNESFAAQPDIPLTNTFGTLWEADIPGQPCGTTIVYHLQATDLNGFTTFSGSRTYKVVCLSPNQFYQVDTATSCVKKSILATGTIIDTSKFFVPHYAGSGTAPKDDGTAGPYDMGGNMPIFGDVARYAWVGVNGAIALSKTATDTLDVSSNGFATAGFDFPQTSHHGRHDTTGRSFMPGNFIAPFWADFIVGDTTHTFGHIRYGHTTDTCEFVVEWDSVGAFDATGPIADVTTFRVILNRCTGVIEYQYNSVGINGLDSAALVGMQADSNAVTGPNPGFVFVNRNIYPYKSKPRNNWCIKFYPGAAVYANDGWNLLSVSTTPADYHKAVLYPSATSQAFRYQAGYVPTDPLSNGPGLWMKFSGRSYAGGPGQATSALTIPVAAGWNMTGSISKTVATSSIVQTPPGIVISSYFDYGVTGYNPRTTIVPGMGYWVKTSAGGTLGLSATVEPKITSAPAAEEVLGRLNSITIQDKRGRVQTLYLGSDASVSAEVLSELPPAAPEFDARFTSGRMVESYPAHLEQKANYQYPISISTDAYPVTLSWNISHPGERKMVLGSGVRTIGVMEGTGSISLKSPETAKNLVVRLTSGIVLPKVFALGQNYPNPFNPTTHFSVDVPHATEVEVAIYDVLGQKITTLMTGQAEAGSHQVEWDSRDTHGMTVPTGIYFVQMHADEFSAVRKIMLMK